MDVQWSFLKHTENYILITKKSVLDNFNKNKNTIFANHRPILL